MIAQRLRSIAVFGDGVVGLSAAVAFQRALPGVTLTIVATGEDPAALADRLPGNLPAVRHFHRLIGLAEQELIRTGAASHRIGTRFEGWRDDAQAWHHCFGEPRQQINSSPFHHQWLRLRSKGAANAYDEYSPAVALARAGKFVHPGQQQSLLRNVDYALRLDPEIYRRHLLELARRGAARFVAGAVAAVVRSGDDRIAHVLLDKEQRIEADLFIDCTGSSAHLISHVGTPFEDWSDLLPCDEVAISGTPAAAEPVDTVTASAAGYLHFSPLPTGSRVISVRSSSRGAEAHEPSHGHVRIRPGVRTKSWVGNVVAFGDSAVTLDPLESTNLYLAQSAIRRAVTLLPDADFQPLVLAEYNRRSLAESERVRDFIAAHYLASPRRSGPFWSSIDQWKVSDSLAHTLEQFQARGRLPKYEEETFSDESWLCVLLGLGFEPRRPDPASFRADEAESRTMLDRLADMSRNLPGQLPSYGDYLMHLRSVADAG